MSFSGEILVFFFFFSASTVKSQPRGTYYTSLPLMWTNNLVCLFLYLLYLVLVFFRRTREIENRSMQCDEHSHDFCQKFSATDVGARIHARCKGRWTVGQRRQVHHTSQRSAACTQTMQSGSITATPGRAHPPPKEIPVVGYYAVVRTKKEKV